MDHSAKLSNQHICYVSCNSCSTILAVLIPCERLSEKMTVECYHCSALSLLSISTPTQGPNCYDHQTTDHHQIFCSKFKNGITTDPSSSKAPFAVKPPKAPAVKRKSKAPIAAKPPPAKRKPTIYAKFMSNELKRMQEAYPQRPYQEVFLAATKNWYKYKENLLQGSVSSIESNNMGNN